MPMSRGQQVVMWKETLGLCRLKPEESVVVFTGDHSRPENVEAATAAVQEIGARLSRLHVFEAKTPLIENRPAMEAMKLADMMIDLAGIHWLRGGEQEAIMHAGTRILYVTEPPDVLARMRPSEDDKRRCSAASRVLKQAKEMHITSAAGTDLRVRLGDFPILNEYGYSDEPGHWDHWPAGFVATWPNEQTANGTVVLDRGDIIFPFNTYVATPIRITVLEGYIRDIVGDFDADYLREYFRQYGDKEAYAVSHLGWGLQPKARWTALGIMKDHTNGNDGRSFYGNFMFSTGPNTDAGGKRNTLCHLDIPMRNCSVALDGTPMLIKGDVIPEDQKVPREMLAR
jgi:2,5-dihydroxypyridine 5,6-dioxygenase